MIIGGFHKFSLIDYPGKICAIVFTCGCNFRCPYCHNPELVEPGENQPALDEKKILTFLEKRKGMLDAVTVTGGEPLLQPDLNSFLLEIKRMGYKIKLDTNGSFPSILEKILKTQSIDFIAMDIKTAPDKYEHVVKRKIEKEKILNSIRLIMESGLDYEFRTTIVKSLIEKDDFYEIGRSIKNSRSYVLQKFVQSKTLDNQFLHIDNYSEQELENIKNIMEGFVRKCTIRQ